MRTRRFWRAAGAVGAFACTFGLGVVQVWGQEEGKIPAVRRFEQSVCPMGDPVPLRACALEQIKTFSPPRTADGKPDLSGYWNGTNAWYEDIEAHPHTWNDSGGPSFIVDPLDGKLPIRPWAAAYVAERHARYIDHNVQCFPSGVPRHLYSGNSHQFIQTPTKFVMLSEESNAYRIVILDGRPPLGRDVTLWQGDSRGRWEGNTLVIETRNQNGRAWIDQKGRFVSDGAVVTERFTMFDRNSLLWEITIDDPLVYTRPFTMAAGLRRNQRPTPELWEEACYEGESSAEDMRGLGLRTTPGLSAKEAQIRKDAYERARSGAAAP
ncbi:MAG: hypothetical protein HYU37_03330 [Acidobacteria bacterium]|nr:hypothetical protein [Acidobacteriota bacterium]